MVDEEVDSETISRVMRDLGRRGGQKKVAKGFSKLSEAERKKNAKKAAEARWGKKGGRAKAKGRSGKKP